MKDCSDRYRDAATSDLPPGSGGVLCGTQTSVDDHGVSEACGDEAPSSGAAWTQSDAVETVDASMSCGTGNVHDGSVTVGTMTEEELKENTTRSVRFVKFTGPYPV